MNEDWNGMPYPRPSPPARGNETKVYLPESGRGCAGPSPPADGDGDGVRSFGDYELLEEIGRGRTGIVYRARHVGLKRQVALKVIRAAPFASREERERFRLEAKAAGQLGHPNIVPIYDVGEHQGRPYFAMKLIEGGSLAERRADFANNISAAARLVAVVSRAIHHAHQRAILHRDLKPANVLLDRAGATFTEADRANSAPAALSLERCQPYVIDLGLAKRLDGVGGLTESGAILGTPGYLAPEQAAPAKALTTAADVYGLGAILYELLTGRPPFQGETDLETLRQVCEEEPVWLRAANPQIDRDLESVCLKCLEKEPARRYASAEALAEDLERWLRGEPVRARRIGPVSRLWKWVRRHPAVATLLVLCILLTTTGLATVRWQWQQGVAVRAELDEQLYAEALAVVERSLAESNEKQAEESLDACPRAARGWEWHCLKRLLREPLQVGSEPPLPPPTGVGTRRSGAVGATAAPQVGTEPLWGTSTWGPSGWVQKRLQQVVAEPLLSPDGRYSANLVWKIKGGGEGRQLDSLASVLDRITGKQVLTLHTDSEALIAVAFSPDSQRFAGLSSTPPKPRGTTKRNPPEPSNRVKVWAIESDKELFSIVSEVWHPFHDFVFTPDSQRIITAGVGGGRASVRVWDARNGRGLVTIGSWAADVPGFFGGNWVSEPQFRCAKLTLNPVGDRLTLQMYGIDNQTRRIDPTSSTVWNATPVSEQPSSALILLLAAGGAALALATFANIFFFTKGRIASAVRVYFGDQRDGEEGSSGFRPRKALRAVHRLLIRLRRENNEPV